jgi:hypothetical protein
MAGRTHLGHDALSLGGFELPDVLVGVSASCPTMSIGSNRATQRCGVCGTRTLTFLTGQPNESERAASKRSELCTSSTLGWNVSRTERHSSRCCPVTPSATRSVPIPRPAALGVLLRSRLRPSGLGFQQKTFRTEYVRLRPSKGGKVFCRSLHRKTRLRHLGAGHTSPRHVNSARSVDPDSRVASRKGCPE